MTDLGNLTPKGKRRRLLYCGVAFSLGVLTSFPLCSADFSEAMTALQQGNAVGGAAIFGDLARSGDGEAMFNLSLLYHYGHGVPQNRERALYWAWKARLAAVPKAHSLVSRLSEVDGEVLPDKFRDILYQRLMSELKETMSQDPPLAFVKMAMIEEDLARKPDRTQIYAWYSLAVAMGMAEISSLREHARVVLSAKEITHAEDLALASFEEWCGLVTKPYLCPKISGEHNLESSSSEG